MMIAAAIVKLYAPWVRSLKEKRMVVKSITSRVRNKFNISICEIDAQDVHQTIVLGMACVAGTARLADAMIDRVTHFIEGQTDAEMTLVQREMR